MKFPLISHRRARAAVAVATAGFRCLLDETDVKLREEQAARRQAEAHARDLEQRLCELTLANQLHDQQNHTEEGQ